MSSFVPIYLPLEEEENNPALDAKKAPKSHRKKKRSHVSFSGVASLKKKTRRETEPACNSSDHPDHDNPDSPMMSSVSQSEAMTSPQSDSSDQMMASGDLKKTSPDQVMTPSPQCASSSTDTRTPPFLNRPNDPVMCDGTSPYSMCETPPPPHKSDDTGAVSSDTQVKTQETRSPVTDDISPDTGDYSVSDAASRREGGNKASDTTRSEDPVKLKKLPSRSSSLQLPPRSKGIML